MIRELEAKVSLLQDDLFYAKSNNVALRELVNESYQFFRFGHKALNPWGKGLDHWCERAEQLGFKKEAQP